MSIRGEILRAGRAIHTDHAPAFLCKMPGAGTPDTTTHPGDQYSFRLSHFSVLPFLCFVQDRSSMYSRPNPSTRFRIVFQCTRSQAAGLELELCGASMTLSIFMSGLSRGSG